MKRKVALFMACILVATMLYACGKQAESKSTTEIKEEQVENNIDTENTEATNVEDAEKSAPSYAITSVEAEGFEHFSGTAECIQITDDQHPELQNAIDSAFSDLVVSFNRGADTLNEEAEEENKDNEEYAKDNPDYEYDEVSYSRNISVDVIRADAKVFSYIVYDYIYTGGAHGLTGVTGFSFDVATGQQLSISDFGDEATIAETAKTFIIDTINNSEASAKDMLFQDDGVISGYEETIKEVFDGDTYPEYYLDYRGIVFVFQQYDIASYAAGIISFTVPYSELEGFNEAYIPDDEFYTARLSELGFLEKIDVNNDGSLEDIYFVHNDNSDSQGPNEGYTLTVGDESISESYEDYIFAEGTFIHSKQGNFVLVSIEGQSITLYDVSNGIKELGTLETEYAVKEIKDGEIILAERIYDITGIKWGESETHNYSSKGIE